MRNYLKKLKLTTKYYIKKYRKLSWSKQALLIIGALFLLQLLIPTGSNSLVSRLDGNSTALMRHDTLTKQYTNDVKAIELAFDNQKATVAPTVLGYTTNASATLAQIPQVSRTDKFIPLWAFVKLLWPANVHTVYSVDSKTRTAYIGTMSNKFSSAPTDAAAKVTSKLTLEITKDEPGYRYDVVKIDAALKDPNFYGNHVIKLKGSKVEATIKPDSLTDVQKQFDALKNQTLSVTYASKLSDTAPEDYLPKLEVISDNNTPKMQFSEQGYSDLLIDLAKTYGLASGIDSTNATVSKVIHKDALNAQLAAWLLKPTNEPILVPTVIIKSASSDTGLQTAISAWVRQRGSGYSVAVVEVGGAGRSAQYSASQQTVLASTYKLFVAWAAYTLAGEGTLSLSTTVYNGQTVEQCIGKAIVNSDNECAKAVGKHIGWAKIESMVVSAGFKNIRLNNYNPDGSFSGDKTGSAAELAKFLQQLQGGTLLRDPYMNKMLGYMRQQIYRKGVPAGSSGSAVADKVGFLSNYTHDVAIVYSPKSTYVVVIMSNKGNNWANIKSLANAIYTNLN